MNTSTQVSFLKKLFIMIICLGASGTNVSAQTAVGLPTCQGYDATLIYMIAGNQIYQYDPAVALSATNPWANTIIGAAGGDGMAVGKNIYAATPATTFYVSGTAGNNYYWYNGTTWVNSGFNPGNGAAVNPTASGNFLYNLVGSSGEIYMNTATANGVLWVTVPTFSGNGPFDLQGDCAGDCYIISHQNPTGFMNEYNSVGTLINSWTVTTAGNVNLGWAGGGFGIVGNTVFMCVNYSPNLWSAPIVGTNLAFTAVGVMAVGAEDFGSCPLGGVSTQTNIDTVFYCGVGPADTLHAPGVGPFTWSVISGNATIFGSGDTVNVIASTTSKIQVSSATALGCTSNLDTFLIVVPGVAASANAGLPDSVLGCGTYIDTLNAHFSSSATWLTYHFNWTPTGSIVSGATTLNPIIQPAVNTQYTFTVTTDSAHGHCLWADSVKVRVVDRTVHAADTPAFFFSCTTVDTVQFSSADTRASKFRWTFGDASPFGSGRITKHLYKNQAIYNAQLLLWNETCADSAALLINLDHPLHSIFQVSKYTICQGEVVNFINNSIDTIRNGISPSYTWDFGDGGTSTATAPTYAYNFGDTGNYTVMLVDQDFVPCTDTSYVTVNIISKPKHFKYDITICNPNSTVTVGKAIGNADKYVWSTGEADSIIIPKATGIYTVTTKNVCGTTEDSVYVSMVNCDQFMQGTELHTPGTPCFDLVDSAGVTVFKQVPCVICFFVPTAFTPNGDGRNDYFHVRANCPIRTYGIEIFNRFGQQVYTNYYFDEGWNGMINGVPADLGVYYYIIKYTPDLPNAHEIYLKGDVTLVR